MQLVNFFLSAKMYHIQVNIKLSSRGNHLGTSPSKYCIPLPIEMRTCTFDLSFLFPPPTFTGYSRDRKNGICSIDTHEGSQMGMFQNQKSDSLNQVSTFFRTNQNPRDLSNNDSGSNSVIYLLASYKFTSFNHFDFFSLLQK